MKGKRIVLTSDRSLMSEHRDSFYFGFATVLPTRLVPSYLQHRIFCPPPPPNSDGTSKYAPVALRCVESAFIENGIPENDVAVVHPNYLQKLIGKDTEFVCVSAQDPLGMGPVTTTWGSMIGGIPFNRQEFERLLLSEIPQLRDKFDFKLIVGGSGSWQISSQVLLNKFMIDHLAMGEAETIVPKIISSPNERILKAPPPDPHEVPSIRNPTASGIIEITRGCGKGCKYCTPTISGKLRSFPLSKIIKDVKVNTNIGEKRTVMMQSDDALNYGSNKKIPNEDAIMELYESIFKIDNVKRVNFTHTCLAPFAYMPEFIERLTKFLRKQGHRYYVCQPGIETGSPRLMKELMPNKCLPYTPDEWPNVVRDAIQVMNKNRWISAATLMVGLPGEEREDILQTIELVKSLEKYNTLFVVPIFFDPIDITVLGDRERIIADKLSEENWRLMVRCWKHNVSVGWKLLDLVSPDQHDLFGGIVMRLGLQSIKLAFNFLTTLFYKKHGRIMKPAV